MILHAVVRYFIQITACMAAVIAFSVLFHAPRKEYLYCGISGTIGWVVYCLLKDLGLGLLITNFAATVVLTLFSWRMSIHRRMPVSVYLIPGIFPLVPGAGIYYTAYYFFMGFRGMATARFVSTMETAGAITVGIMLGSYLIRLNLHIGNRPGRQKLNENDHA